MGKYSKKTHKRRDIERELADKFIESLNLINEGILSRPTWVAGWDRKLGRPRNGLSGHKYRGINVLMTLLSGHSDPRWYTRNQILERCGYEWAGKGKGYQWAGKGPKPETHPLKGQKSTPIVYYGSFTKEQENAAGEKEERRIMFLKYNNNWNHQQVAWPEGTEPKLKGGLGDDPRDGNDKAQDIWKDHEPETSWGGAAACYSPKEDRIVLPEPKCFKSSDHYWSTALHELAHWTGHVKRLARDGVVKSPAGRRTYAIEELIAEMASAFLCAAIDIEVEKLNHEDYILNWAKAIDDDPKVLMKAARKAQEIVDYLLREEPPSYED